MPESNFSELRRVRSEMSAEAGHDVRRFIELLGGVRARYWDQIVNWTSQTCFDLLTG